MTETKKSKPLIKEETDKGSFKDRYKDCIANLSKVPTVNIKGKQYSTVAERHRHLKKYFPESASADELTVALLSQGQSQAKVSIKDKINQQTTETKLNKLYSDWEQENDQIKKSFENKQKNIKEDGGQNVKSNW
jgi:hypothetical protein